MTLTADERTFLDELAAHIAAEGGLSGRTMNEALVQAHAARQAFAREIREGQTTRAKMARRAIAHSVYAGIHVREIRDHAARRTMADCEAIAA